MLTGFKEVNGLLWPQTDTECMRVTFNQVHDVDLAIRLCTRRTIVVQAGGNCGVWPLHLADWFDQVFTFEPEPSNFVCLQANCRSFNNIVRLPWGLGSGQELPMRPHYAEGMSNMGAVCLQPGGRVRVVAIDDFQLFDCALIQLDVEGFEPYVLEGAKQTIEKFRPVVMLEDKGLTRMYNEHYQHGWSKSWAARNHYRLAVEINRDYIYVPEEEHHGRL